MKILAIIMISPLMFYLIRRLVMGRVFTKDMDASYKRFCFAVQLFVWGLVLLHLSGCAAPVYECKREKPIDKFTWFDVGATELHQGNKRIVEKINEIVDENYTCRPIKEQKKDKVHDCSEWIGGVRTCMTGEK